MSHTFEELASPELDALYQGALFLSCGDADSAEHLLVDTVTLAFRERPSEMTTREVERWLEARLTRAFLRQASEGPTQLPLDTLDRVALEEGSFEFLEAHHLYDAASSVPVWPRAALWLVMLRRWSYSDAASVMEIDVSVLAGLLGYRDLLMQTMLGSGRRRAAEGGVS